MDAVQQLLQQVNEAFRNFAAWSARTCGSPWAFVLAMGLTLVWAVTGPFFRFSDTWQLVINTATTVLTFLVVFLIQNTTNREFAAIQVKLDELLKAIGGARTRLVDLEEMSDDEIEELKNEFRRLHARTATRQSRPPQVGLPQTSVPASQHETEPASTGTHNGP